MMTTIHEERSPSKIVPPRTKMISLKHNIQALKGGDSVAKLSGLIFVNIVGKIKRAN